MKRTDMVVGRLYGEADGGRDWLHYTVKPVTLVDTDHWHYYGRFSTIPSEAHVEQTESGELEVPGIIKRGKSSWGQPSVLCRDAEGNLVVVKTRNIRGLYGDVVAEQKAWREERERAAAEWRRKATADQARREAIDDALESLGIANSPVQSRYRISIDAVEELLARAGHDPARKAV